MADLSQYMAISSNISNLAGMPPKKPTKKKAAKRPDKYEKKLKLTGTFEQLFDAIANPKNPLKKK